MELSDYERQRNANVQEREKMLQTLLQGMGDFIKKENITPKKLVVGSRPDRDCVGSKLKTTPNAESVSAQRRHRRRIYKCSDAAATAVPVTRSRTRLYANDPDMLHTRPRPIKKHTRTVLIVKFPFNKKFGTKSGEVDDDDEIEVFEDEDEDCCDDLFEYESYPRKRSAHTAASRRVIPADEISQADLNRVVTGGVKVYDPTRGTTCHQCRQKTSDMKTVCRSDSCHGIRGQFCGTCLKNRYGEDAKVALLDPNWICPPCREICNCSFCRKKTGRQATGILIYDAKMSGYNSVHDYLDNTET